MASSNSMSESGALIRRSRNPRSPEIRGIWHDAFRDPIGKERRRHQEPAGGRRDRIAGGLGARVRRARRRLPAERGIDPRSRQGLCNASPELLDIPVNKLPGAEEAKLLMYRDDQRRSPLARYASRFPGNWPSEIPGSVSTPILPPLPRRHRIRISPQPASLLLGLGLDLQQGRILGVCRKTQAMPCRTCSALTSRSLR